MIMTSKVMTEKVNLKKESFFTLVPNQTNRESHEYKLGKKKATKKQASRSYNDRKSPPKMLLTPPRPMDSRANWTIIGHQKNIKRRFN